MRARLLVGLLLSSVLAWSCRSSSSSTPTINGVVVAGDGAFTSRSATRQLTATANKSDGTTQDVTSAPGVAWTSSNNGIATVTSTGLVTSVSNGTANIAAAYQGSTGNLAVIVTLRATAVVTPLFKRLCGPNRAGIDITIAETGGSAYFDISSITVRFRDLAGNIRVTRTYANAGEVSVVLGSNRITAGGSRSFSFEQAYVPAENTEDSSAQIELNGTDEFGNAVSVNLPSIRQSDRC